VEEVNCYVCRNKRDPEEMMRVRHIDFTWKNVCPGCLDQYVEDNDLEGKGHGYGSQQFITGDRPHP